MTDHFPFSPMLHVSVSPDGCPGPRHHHRLHSWHHRLPSQSPVLPVSASRRGFPGQARLRTPPTPSILLLARIRVLPTFRRTLLGLSTFRRRSFGLPAIIRLPSTVSSRRSPHRLGTDGRLRPPSRLPNRLSWSPPPPTASRAPSSASVGFRASLHGVRSTSFGLHGRPSKLLRPPRSPEQAPPAFMSPPLPSASLSLPSKQATGLHSRPSSPAPPALPSKTLPAKSPSTNAPGLPRPWSPDLQAGGEPPRPLLAPYCHGMSIF